MTPDRFQRARELFEAARDLNPAGRTAFLEKACGDDSELRAEVLALLASHERSGDFLARHAASVVATSTMVRDEDYAGSVLAGRYQIEKELGRGGFGIVYLARDQKMHGRIVVVKILQPKQNRQDWIEKKFREECEALTRIDHPGVVHVLDYGETDDHRQFLAMQFIEGASLREEMRRGPMAPRRIAGFIRQIAAALDTIHRHRVFHRDLKPENIMIRDLGQGDEQAVIIDFGVATVKHDGVEDVTHTRVAGSFPYMAPEQLAGRPQAASDIYALGVMAFEMLDGHRPFDEGANWNGVPESVQHPLRKALSLDPAARHEKALEFGDELARELLPAENTPSRRAWLAAIPIAAIGVLGGWLIKSSIAKDERILHYRVLIQKFQDGTPSGPPSWLQEPMRFLAGQHIRLVVRSPQAGYLYLISEAPVRSVGGPAYHVLFPSRAAEGRAVVAAGVDVSLPSDKEYYAFDDEQGEETVWLIWAKNPPPELESVKKWVNPRNLGVIEDPSEESSIRTFLARYSAGLVPNSTEASGINVVRRDGDLLIHPLRLRHD